MNFSVTRRFEFCAAHFLPDYEGKCKDLHGHNYVLEVEVGHDIQNHYDTPQRQDNWSYEGTIVDFSELKHFVEVHVIDHIDHKVLNDVFSDSYMPPTAENMCRWIWDCLDDYQFKGKIQRIRVWETSNCYAELRI